MLAMSVVTLATVFAMATSRTDNCVAPKNRSAQSVPIEFVEGRYFVRWPLKSGDTLRLYLDTGGSLDQLSSSAVRRLRIAQGVARDAELFGTDTVPYAELSRSLLEQLAPAIRNNWRLGNPRNGAVRLMITPAEWESKFPDPSSKPQDGLLGPEWFADRVWTMDYPAERLLHHGDSALTSIPASCWVPLGFQVDAKGKRPGNFPRIQVKVDGDTIDMLFDSGAQTYLTESAQKVVAPGAGRFRAASFIVRDVFERWRARHPEWTVVENSDAMFPGVRMIRVPEVEIGGEKLGPVWFSARPNAAFHDWFSQFMDRRIDGAIGGSAFRDVVVVVDYPRSRAAVLRKGGELRE